MELAAKIVQFFADFAFFREAAITSTLAGAMLGAVGVYIFLGRRVFLSAALGQISSLGAVLTMWLLTLLGFGQIADNLVILCSILFALAILAITGPLMRRSPTPDAVLALLYIGGAAGTVLVGSKIVGKIHDISTLLVGDAVLVEHSDYLLMIGLFALIVPLFLYGERAFKCALFWHDMAKAAGVPVRLIQIILYSLLVVVIAISGKILGSLPVFALSCLPAMAARHFRHLNTMFLAALLLGASCGFGGYLGAYVLEFPVGATQSILAVLLVLMADFIFYLSKVIRRFNNAKKINA